MPRLSSSCGRREKSERHRRSGGESLGECSIIGQELKRRGGFTALVEEAQFHWTKNQTNRPAEQQPLVSFHGQYIPELSTTNPPDSDPDLGAVHVLMPAHPAYSSLAFLPTRSLGRVSKLRVQKHVPKPPRKKKKKKCNKVKQQKLQPGPRCPSPPGRTGPGARGHPSTEHTQT